VTGQLHQKAEQAIQLFTPSVAAIRTIHVFLKLNIFCENQTRSLLNWALNTGGEIKAGEFPRCFLGQFRVLQF